MKVAFKATIEDFVDVAKRSLSLRSHWKGVGIWVLFGGGIIGILGYFVFQNGFGAAVGFLVGALIMIGLTWDTSDAGLKQFFAKHYDTEWPVDVEIELLAEGVSCKHLDHRTIFQWQYVERLEETDDAIYFFTRYHGVVAARKGGFDSNEEKDVFLKLAREMMHQNPEMES